MRGGPGAPVLRVLAARYALVRAWWTSCLRNLVPLWLVHSRPGCAPHVGQGTTSAGRGTVGAGPAAGLVVTVVSSSR